MHDFEDRIDAWKKQALTALGGDADAVEELESHLRQSLEELSATMPAGLAWAAAVDRLGDLEKLKREFAKAQPSGAVDAALMWIIVAACLFTMLAFLLPILARREPGKGADTLLMVHVVCVLVGYMASIAGGILGGYFGLRLILAGARNRTLTRSMPTIAASLSGIALVMSTLGVVLGAVWAHREWGVAWNWDGKELGGLCVVVMHAAMMVALARGRMSKRALLAMSAVAAPVTTGAWFVLVLIVGGLHDYRAPTFVGAWFIGSLACLAIASLAWRRVRREELLPEAM